MRQPEDIRLLVMGEFSGVVRDAFLALGVNAMSCDLLPTERPGPHYQGDVRDILYDGWDGMIAHPSCTYLCNSGVRWLHTRPGRWADMERDAAFFKMLLNCRIPYKGIENPIPHRYALEIIGRKYDQIIQPWQFGHGETKATCLWLEGLPKLVPADVVSGREWRIHRMSPGPNRGHERSRTYPGIARAMAAQWTPVLLAKTF